MADKAVILLSGGLDSATALAIASNIGYQCFAISFDYGQRHRCELEAAKRVAVTQAVFEHKIFKLNLNEFGGSALTDNSIDVPKNQQASTENVNNIPITYVPARNTIFLSIALGWAEVLQAKHIYVGVNAVDYSGYPDCRPEYIDAFSKMANLATKVGVEGMQMTIETPLISLSKAEIIKLGTDLGVNYNDTISCYDPTESGAACAVCESCRLRAEGFRNAGISDTTNYK
ncbi:7-cyano-7-deazaguanine synthase [hydrothermal vent metagenome]|uniref:7-cyano-7-deazaguanine synthase n=1 Tax=hydrothermal vent metagenome TaxID=652676 RepID=A0A3B1A0W7_9ZZZZ